MNVCRVERIFTYLRGANLKKNNHPEIVSFSIFDFFISFPIRILAYLFWFFVKIPLNLALITKAIVIFVVTFRLSRFGGRIRRFLINAFEYTFETQTVAVFLTCLAITAAISLNISINNYRGVFFGIILVFALFISFAVSLIITVVTAKFSKIQGTFIEKTSQIGKISENLALSLQLINEISPSKFEIKTASAIIKERIDSANDLLNLSTIFSSLGIMLVALSFFIEWSEPAALKNGSHLNQETIAKIISGISFLCFFYIRVFGYLRLQTLRAWQTVLDAAFACCEEMEFLQREINK